MNDKKTWWEMVPIGKTGWISVGVIVFALLTFLAVSVFWTPSGRDSFALQEQEDKIREMEDRVAKLQRELEESSKQIARFQDRSDEPRSERRSNERRVIPSRREETRVASQRPAQEMRFYETVRNTAVFEEPSASSRKVATIPNGSKVRVVGSTGDWLEVRSKQGRPPGFIRTDDAVLMK
jgi:membrane protein implicated in regulation of membrane protease activity